MIEFLGGKLYKYSDGKYEFNVSLLSDKVIFIYGDVGYQYFQIPYITSFRNLPTLYKSLESIKKYAQNYIDALANKNKFREQMQRLTATGVIDKLKGDSILKTVEFFEDGLPAEVIRNQLRMNGLGHTVDLFDFEEEDPHLLETCEAFRRFISEIPQFLDREGDTESEHNS